MRGEDPDHPIIERPHEYSVTRFVYDVLGNRVGEPFIDLSLSKGELFRRLRFLSPQNLRIEEGFPAPTHGMAIRDIRGRQWQGLGVEVADFEASWGAITFVARAVVDLDDDSES